MPVGIPVSCGRSMTKTLRSTARTYAPLPGRGAISAVRARKNAELRRVGQVFGGGAHQRNSRDDALQPYAHKQRYMALRPHMGVVPREARLDYLNRLAASEVASLGVAGGGSIADRRGRDYHVGGSAMPCHRTSLGTTRVQTRRPFLRLGCRAVVGEHPHDPRPSRVLDGITLRRSQSPFVRGNTCNSRPAPHVGTRHSKGSLPQERLR